MTSLQTRLTLIVVGVLIVSLWTLAVAIDVYQRERLVGLLTGQQEATVNYIAEDIDHKIQFRLDGLTKLTEDFPFEVLDDPATLAAYLSQRRVIYNLFDLGLIVVKPDLSRALGDYPELPGRRDTPYRLSPFREAAESGRPVVGPPRVGRFSSRPVVVMAVPLKDAAGTLRAVIAGVVTIDSSNFLDLINKTREGMQGDFMVVSPSERMVVAGTRPEYVLLPLPAKGVDKLLDRYMDGYAGSGLGVGVEGEEELTSSSPIPSADWLVMAKLQTSEAFAPVQELRTLVFGGSALLSLLVGLVAAIYLRRSLAPLKEAAEAFDSVSQGRSPLHALPTHGHDEVATLVESFNRLQERLSSETKALEASEARYRQFVSDSPLGVMIVQNGIICFANPALEALVGFPEAELVGRSIMPFIAEPDRERAAEVHRRRMAGEPVPEMFEYRVNTGRGELRHWRLAIRTVEWNGPAAHIVVTDVTELKCAEEQLQRNAHFDALTGIPNRVLLADRLRQGLVQTSRSGRLMAICYLDLDGFKPVNDTWGHEAGDRLLVEMAERLKLCLRGGDTVARLGGDEFVLLLLGIERIDECEGALQRVLDSVARPVLIGEQMVSLSASIGVSVYPFDSEEPDVLLRQADQAMYLAKEGGRNRYRLFEVKNLDRTTGSKGANGFHAQGRSQDATAD